MTPLAEASAIPQPQNQKSPTPPPSVDKIIIDIANFKVEAVSWASEALANDKSRSVPILEVKEVKDLVHIITSIEGTFKPDETGGTTINILFQNMMTKYSDDC